MALFKNLFKPQSPAPKPMQVPPVPKELPKITAPNAAQLAKSSDPSPAAKQLLTSQQTPSQYLSALQEKKLGNDMVKTMAHGLSDRDGVHWAAQSAEKVSGKLPAGEVQAMKAAQTWVKNPTDANKAAAAAAAAKTNHQGPGAWAAQGAAWAQPATTAAPQVGAPATPRLTPHAVSGAVLLAAATKTTPTLVAPAIQPLTAQKPALTAPKLETPQLATPQLATPHPSPEIQAQAFKEQHPFIALGLDVASGKNTWA